MNLHHKFERPVVAHSSSSRTGFILPALVVFSLVLASMGVVALQYITASTNAIQSTNFRAVAKSAADAGLQHALSCLDNQLEGWSNLAPNTDCEGAAVSGGQSTLSQGGIWQSTYSVAAADERDGNLLITSTGSVNFFYAGATVASKTFTSTSKASVPVSAAGDIRDVAEGKAVTKISAGNNITCAIANMELHCSGSYAQGRMANNVDAPSAYYLSPARINPAEFNGKTITDVQVNSYNHCAIANGQSYCWGVNSRASAGNGVRQSRIGPTPPNTVAGTVSGVTSFDSGQTRIASPGKSWDEGSQYSCFLNQLRVFCAGSNISAQLGRPYIGCFGLIICSWSIRDDPDHSLRGSTARDSTIPQRVYGYDTNQETETRYRDYAYYSQSQLFGTRPSHLESGAYYACTLVNTRMFCWGDRFVTDGVDINSAPDDIGNIKAVSGWYSATTQPVSAMGVGESTSCFVSNGELYCRGYYPGNGTTAQNAIGVNGPSMPHERWNTIKVPNSSSSHALYGVNVEGFNSHSDNYMCAYGDGDAYCWGTGSTAGNASLNDLSPARIIAGSDPSAIDRPNVTSVAAGFDQICVVANGSQYCRGHNNYTGATPNRRGVLGTGDSNNYTTSNYTKKSHEAIGLTKGEAATKIASGNNHSCAVANNYVYCWGNNSNGQIGDGTTISRNQPTGINIEGVANFKTRAATHVTAGANHSCAIVGGDAYCWGSNSRGQIGNGSTSATPVTKPVKVNIPSNYKVTSIDAGDEHTCAVANGRAYCWGSNSRGQIGNGSISATPVTNPAPVSTLSAGNTSSSEIPTHITTGSNFSCAIANARAYCWGDNSHGQVGVAASSVARPTPSQVSSGSPAIDGARDEWTALDAGSNFVCGAINQVVRCWGNNSSGQLGRTTANTHIPGTVTGASGQNVGWKKTTQLTAGASHACAIANGEAHCWGAGAQGQLGDGLTASRSATGLVSRQAGFLLENNIYDLSAGGNHTCGIANGKIMCWGRNNEGQLGNTSNSNSTTPTLQGKYHRQSRSIDVGGATVF